jgi:hypothetical protein
MIAARKANPQRRVGYPELGVRFLSPVVRVIAIRETAWSAHVVPLRSMHSVTSGCLLELCGPSAGSQIAQ